MCDRTVTTYANDREITLRCRELTYPSARAALCEPCRKQAEDRYPQGWRHKPGDTCTHGVFVKTDRDCPCPACEG